ncbi:SpoIID/LytB domain-containing protein [Kovacikia minuta CCNUW1]|uniref:SpoIID/LytB domain-containing protein n=1 Tax=Kovacikia minuta TaxID=2931930 RepID=UPI001CCD5122|nr:SpoIID/LytB domain-containing protein [Kovacikia minuta]UBF25290.1 SpoIID/LytB domain-containing protein [Kovacikia minuta CCNUW1]
MPLERFPVLLLSQLVSLIRSGRSHWWLFVVFWLAAIAPARSAAVEMRVAIKEGVSQVKVGSSTPAVVRDGANRPLGNIAAMNAFVAQSGYGRVGLSRWQAGQIWIEPSGGGYVFIGDRWYRGRTLLVSSQKGLTAINYVDLEQYLYSVLGGEMNGNWPQEALKAQAIAARSYALYKRERASNKIFDVGDTPTWQVYDGLIDESAGTQAAVEATKGQVLTYKGQIIEAVFHSSAGGCTENVENVWTQPLPYLRSVKDFDQGSPVYQWTKTFSRSELSKRISGVGNILSLEPEKVTGCGRIVTMKVIGDRGRRIVSGASLRSALGLKSTLFRIVPQTASASGKQKSQGVAVVFQVNGQGFGHGLGMSQWGAHNLAQQGANYLQILLHYYSSTTLAKIQVQ